MDRDVAIRLIRTALRKRSGKDWSVTGGKGTAWGWLTIDAPPRRRTWRFVQTRTPEPPAPGAVYAGVRGVTPHTCVGPFALDDDRITSPAEDPWAREAAEKGLAIDYTWEVEDPTYKFGHASPAERAELARLLGVRDVHHQGRSIPASSDYWQEYVDRAEGREPTVCGEQYWD
jgi:hypothetical protein